MPLPPVYCIACPEFPDRWDAARKHFDGAGVRVHWWRGVAGRTWGIETTREYDPGWKISPGHVGLLLAHWNLWNHLSLVLDKDDDCAIVCEDDVVLPDNFHAVAQDVRTELLYCMRDWDLVFLGLAEYSPGCWDKVTRRIGGPHSRLCQLSWPWGTHCLMIRKKALPVLMDNMTAAERNMDQQLYSRVLSKDLLQWCAVLPSPVLQRTHDHRKEGVPEWAPSTVAPEDLGRLREEGKWKGMGVHQTAEQIEATIGLVDPFPCLYRGEYLDEVGRLPSGKSVPLAQCAQLNMPCHSKRGVDAATDDGLPAVRCETCAERLEMANGEARGNLILKEHFNPSMIEFNGRVILATRDSWGHSKIGLWEMTNSRDDWSGSWTPTPISSVASDDPQAPRLEDPRLFLFPDGHGNDLCAMLNLPDGYPPKKVNVGYVRFSKELDRVVETVIFPSPFMNLYEKSWVMWSDSGSLRMVYSAKPDHLVFQGGKVCPGVGVVARRWRTPNNLPWIAGMMRGGASPVLVKNDPHHGGLDVMYHFFHSVLKRMQGNVYTVGCYTFDPSPPYSILKQTVKPLIWPDLPADKEDVVKRFVVFPGGAILKHGHWHIAAGVDDTYCRIYRLGYDEVGRQLNGVEESESQKFTSIQNSPIATGIKSI